MLCIVGVAQVAVEWSWVAIVCNKVAGVAVRSLDVAAFHSLQVERDVK